MNTIKDPAIQDIVRQKTAEGMMQKDIAAELGLQKSSISRFLSGLIGKRYEPPQGNWKQYGDYHVGDDGRVWSIPRGMFLKPDVDKDGYRIVTLSLDRRMKKIKLHRLVLLVWGRNPEPGEIARHKNHDPSNNRIENLLWGTQSDNEKDKRTNGTANRHYTHPESQFTPEQVSSLRAEWLEVLPILDANRNKKGPNKLTRTNWLRKKAEIYQVQARAIDNIVSNRTYNGDYLGETHD